MKIDIKGMIDEIETNTALLTTIHQNLVKTMGAKIAEIKRSLTIEHDGISISRNLLKHSNFVTSAGYDQQTKCMDIAFNTGKVYRYKNVPSTFYESLETRSSLKGLRNDLSAFEYEQLE